MYDDELSLDRVAGHVGVHYQTVYRWVRAGRLPAKKVKGSYLVKRGDLDDFVTNREQPSAVPPPSQRRVKRQRDNLGRALHKGNEAKVRSIALDLIASGMTVTELIESVLAPPLVEIGAQWHEGKLDIYVEHRAAAIVERILGLVSPNPSGRRRGRVLVAAAAGDEHSLPTSMATAALREDNWHVEHLGADVPPEELQRFAASHAIDLAVISCSVIDRSSAQEARDLLEESLGIPTRIGSPGASLAELQLWARAAPRSAKANR